MFYYLLLQGSVLEKIKSSFLEKQPKHIQVAIVGSLCYMFTHIIFFSGIMNSFHSIQPYFWALFAFDLFLTNATLQQNTNPAQNTSTTNPPSLQQPNVKSALSSNTNSKIKKHVSFQDEPHLDSETNVESEIDVDLSSFEEMLKK